MTEGIGHIFTGELEVRNEDSIINDEELFPHGNDFSNFSPGFACLRPKFHM